MENKQLKIVENTKKIQLGIMRKFWKKYKNKSSKIKLRETKFMGESIFQNPESYAYRRRRKHPLTVNRICWICSFFADLKHHVIWLRNGGYDKTWNRMPVFYIPPTRS